MKPNIPTVFVIFGATGDLMTKKITPALFQLYLKERLPKLLRIIGVARRDLGDEGFKNHVLTILENHEDLKIHKNKFGPFISLFLYKRGDFQSIDVYNNLAKTLGRIDNEWKACSNKLYYLAVPPQYYETMFKHLASSGLTIPCGPEEGWTRVLVEKPFGKDLKTAEELDLMLGKLFREEQIFRIDHYLAKEMLQNILTFRFSNNLFEPSWGKELIERINVRLLEKIGVEGRGAFYDGIGALRDVGQNHLLQMLAGVTMDRPVSLSSNSVREKRAELLKKLHILTRDEIKKFTYRFQYEGYKKIEDVSPDSTTETYFKVKTFILGERFKGVQIILEGGKRVKDGRREIEIEFRHPTPCLCPPGRHFKNKIVISIEPIEAITIHFWSKKPGFENVLEERTLNFLYRDLRRKVEYIEEYEKLLLDCIEGNQLLFLSTDEVRATWRFIDPILKAWKENLVSLKTYKPDTNQPLED